MSDNISFYCAFLFILSLNYVCVYVMQHTVFYVVPFCVINDDNDCTSLN